MTDTDQGSKANQPKKNDRIIEGEDLRIRKIEKMVNVEKIKMKIYADRSRRFQTRYLRENLFMGALHK